MQKTCNLHASKGIVYIWHDINQTLHLQVSPTCQRQAIWQMIFIVVWCNWWCVIKPQEMSIHDQPFSVDHMETGPELF